VAGAEETFFFGGDGEEKEAALRARGGREGGVGLGELEEDGGAGGVVEGAVEDLVAGEFGVAAEVVPVGGEDDVFVAVGGRGAVEAGDDVFGADVAGGLLDGEIRLAGQSDGFEGLGGGGGFEGFEVLAGGGRGVFLRSRA
jgi:hypothetical protein